MVIHINVNGQDKSITVAPNETLLQALRREGYYSVKHGCETGECGACGVIMKLRHGDASAGEAPLMTNTCVMLAAQADGAQIVTVESLGDRTRLSTLQQCFIDNGSIQCGYCTPAQLLAAKTLLDKNPSPGEAEVREAISGVLCRCTGYLKPVQAVLTAAAKLRGENPEPPPMFKLVHAGGGSSQDSPDGEAGSGMFRQDIGDVRWGGRGGPQANPSSEAARQAVDIATKPLPDFVVAPTPEMQVVGKAEKKVDAAKLAQGKPAFVDDAPLPGMLYAAMLTSPHAHARIKHIDTTKAKALPGVHAVLTHKDVKRVIYASGGQSYPNPPPYDQVCLDNKVRHVGDRVAVVAAETFEIAERACQLIEVEYEVLPAVFDPDEAMQPGAPVIHDEPDALMILDASRNLVNRVHAVVGDPARAFGECDWTIEREYRVPQQQQASIEPHVCMTWWDEDDRLVIRTSTQVPFHVRRMIAPLIGLPVKKIRVVKPRVGGGFGGKQEMLIEDLCAHLTLATGRPVRFEYTRAQEFTSARSRHPQRMVYKLGFKKNPDGGAPVLHALTQYVLGNTGAYGTHGLTVQTVSGLRGTAQYRCPNMAFDCDIVYTNLPTPGAFRGYGAPQAEYGLECVMDEAAQMMNVDPIALRRQNWIRSGDPLLMAKQLGEGREGFEQVIESCGLAECFDEAMRAIDWDGRDARRLDPARPNIRRGTGTAMCMHASAIAGLDMGAASLKMNDDASFNCLVGGTDIGTGSDTVIGQIVAETLGVPLEDVIMYSSDTDFTPFDTGAYASSTTYITGGAAKKAAEQVREQIREVAVKMFEHGKSVQQAAPDSPGVRLAREQGALALHDRKVFSADGRCIELEKLALFATHQENQRQIMATASHMSYDSPPPFGCQMADVEVDIETGEVKVLRLIMAVDCGVPINPATSAGQIEGGNVQALGYAHCEEMRYDAAGRVLNARLGPYRIYASNEVPELQAILVQTYEPTGPYGAKAVAEIPMDGVAPAIANAIYHATGVRLHKIPVTPERVWRALNGREDATWLM